MKRSSPRQSARYQIFVLTPEEKRTLCFVLIMFLLGLAAEHYRVAHSIPPSRIAVDETATTTARPAQKRAESKRPKPTN